MSLTHRVDNLKELCEGQVRIKVIKMAKFVNESGKLLCNVPAGRKKRNRSDLMRPPQNEEEIIGKTIDRSENLRHYLNCEEALLNRWLNNCIIGCCTWKNRIIWQRGWRVLSQILPIFGPSFFRVTCLEISFIIWTYSFIDISAKDSPFAHSTENWITLLPDWPMTFANCAPSCQIWRILPDAPEWPPLSS